MKSPCCIIIAEGKLIFAVNEKKKASLFTVEMERALRRARQVAPKTARMQGTPITLGAMAKSSPKSPELKLNRLV